MRLQDSTIRLQDKAFAGIPRNLGILTVSWGDRVLFTYHSFQEGQILQKTPWGLKGTPRIPKVFLRGSYPFLKAFMRGAYPFLKGSSEGFLSLKHTSIRTRVNADNDEAI